MTLKKRFEDFLKQHDLVQKGDSVLIATSGGIDSMVLLNLFREIQQSWSLTLVVAHVNHQLRGKESDDDESFVRSIAERANLPFFTERVNVSQYAETHKCSLQVAARILRYNALERMRQTAQATVIATAHHRDDNAETVLINLLRGTGIRGFAGIPVVNKGRHIVRPLLFATRKEIEAYKNFHNIPYREDSSNAQLKYERNIIRHSVFPALSAKYHRNIQEIFATIAEQIRHIPDQIDALVSTLLPNILIVDNTDQLQLNLEEFKQISPFLQDEILLRALETMRLEPTEQKVSQLLSLINLPVGKLVTLSGEVIALRDRHAIVLQRKQKNRESFTIKIGEECCFHDFSFSAYLLSQPPAKFQSDENCAFVDSKKLGQKIILRYWQKGDWFVPLGMSKPKKLSDFFTDIKLSRFEKETTPIVESDGTIVWVCGKRLDDRFKITSDTTQCIQFTYYPNRRTHESTAQN